MIQVALDPVRPDTTCRRTTPLRIVSSALTAEQRPMSLGTHDGKEPRSQSEVVHRFQILATQLPVLLSRRSSAARRPSPTAAARLIWLLRTGRTRRRRQFRDTCRTRRCKTRSLRPGPVGENRLTIPRGPRSAAPRPGEQVYRPGRPALVVPASVGDRAVAHPVQAVSTLDSSC
jgi:hypothetical protein